MKTLAKVALGAVMLGTLGGCAMATGGSGSVSGYIYSGYSMGGVISSGTGTKTGESCASSILGIIATGDATVSAAKAAGGIKTVAHVDHNIFSVLGIYATSCTVVVGE